MSRRVTESRGVTRSVAECHGVTRSITGSHGVSRIQTKLHGVARSATELFPFSCRVSTFQGEVSYHSKRVRESALLFDFGRIPQWNCPIAGKKQVMYGDVWDALHLAYAESTQSQTTCACCRVRVSTKERGERRPRRRRRARRSRGSSRRSSVTSRTTGCTSRRSDPPAAITDTRPSRVRSWKGLQMATG